MLIFLKFCRLLKPKFKKDAAVLLRDEFAKLRTNDSASSMKKSSMRLTVRQLESLVRLSEALAKVHADQYVRVEYVKEATRLLSKSIIPIRQEGVEL